MTEDEIVRGPTAIVDADNVLGVGIYTPYPTRIEAEAAFAMLPDTIGRGLVVWSDVTKRRDIEHRAMLARVEARKAARAACLLAAASVTMRFRGMAPKGALAFAG